MTKDGERHKNTMTEADIKHFSIVHMMQKRAERDIAKLTRFDFAAFYRASA